MSTDIHETMKTLGRLAQLVYPDREIPENILAVLLARPAASVAAMMAGVEPTAAIRQLVGKLPADMPAGPVSTEDQGGFWLGWYASHGGARKGAGRPAAVASLRRMNVMLDDETVERAKQLGDGNLSAGLRVAVAAASASEKAKQ